MMAIPAVDNFHKRMSASRNRLTQSGRTAIGLLGLCKIFNFVRGHNVGTTPSACHPSRFQRISGHPEDPGERRRTSMNKPYTARATAAVVFMLLAPAAMAQTTLAPREEPAKTIPVPSDVSPQLQAVIPKPLTPGWNPPPTTPEGWKQFSNKAGVAVAAQAEAMAQRLHV